DYEVNKSLISPLNVEKLGFYLIPL
ncbi:hypothetical protein SAMN05192534_1131, partial [Alteribacillus persepolensis]